MRSSKQRDLILSIVSNSYSHPTAEEIYELSRKTIPNISLGTVYRNLNTLYGTGDVRRIKAKDNTYRYDRNEDRHAHLICVNCNKIIDIDKEVLGNLGMVDGNKIIDYDVSFTGVCKDCLNEGGI